MKGCFSIASGTWSQWLSDLDNLPKSKIDSFILKNIVFTLLENLSPSRGDTVVDFGAGEGLVSLELAKAVGSSGKVIAIDESAECLEVIKKRSLEKGFLNIETLRSRIEDCPLPPSSTDGVTCRSVLCYLNDMRLGVSKMLEVLRPQGSFSVFEPLMGEGSWRGGTAPPPEDFRLLEASLRATGAPRSLVREAVREAFASENAEFKSLVVHYKFSFEKLARDEIIRDYLFDLPGELSAHNLLVKTGYDEKKLERVMSNFSSWAAKANVRYVLPCIFIHGTKKG